MEHCGFIAQDVEAIASHERYGFVKYQPENGFSLVLTEFIAPIIKAVQELDERINLLEAEKGTHDKFKLGDCKVGGNDPLGDRHDLEKDMGNV